MNAGSTPADEPQKTQMLFTNDLGRAVAKGSLL